MLQLLLWHNLIFYIPLVFGSILVLGMLFGMVDSHTAEVDVDSDLEHSVFSLLGIGRMPLVLVLSVCSLTFGAVSVMVKATLMSSLGVGWAVACGLLAGTIVMITVTATVSKVFLKYIPTLETKSVSRYDLVGCGGKVMVSVDARPGLVQVTHDGDVFNLRCLSPDKSHAPGEDVLIIGYDDVTDTYTVCRDPATTTE